MDILTDARARIGVSPLPAAKLLLARGSSSHHSPGLPGGAELRGGEAYGYGSGGGGGGATSAALLCASTQGATSARTASCASGLPSCTGVGSLGAMSAVMLDSNAEAQEGRFAQAAMMTVHGVDDTWGMRGMMGALVESIMTTLKGGPSELVEEANNGYAEAAHQGDHHLLNPAPFNPASTSWSRQHIHIHIHTHTPNPVNNPLTPLLYLKPRFPFITWYISLFCPPALQFSFSHLPFPSLPRSPGRNYKIPSRTVPRCFLRGRARVSPGFSEHFPLPLSYYPFPLSYYPSYYQGVNEFKPPCLPFPHPRSAELGGLHSLEGLEDLHLAEVLGHGASGVVLRGMLGTVPVAVKLMEMPDADYDVLSTEVGLALAQGPINDNGGRGQTDIHPDLLEEPLVKSLASMAPSGTSAKLMMGQQPQPVDGPLDRGEKENRGYVGDEGREPQHQPEMQGDEVRKKQQQPKGPWPGPGAGTEDAAAFAHQRKVGRQQTESEQLRARRTMLRNATELAVMRMVSHVCIVQAFAVYDNVIMERPPYTADSFVLRRLDPKNPDTGGSPICTAIVQELCDCGSLADVLSDHSFPNVIYRPAAGAAAGTPARAPGHLVERSLGSRVDIDMKGVYLTLLEIALALKHLHSRRLVHRDVKPANILLKTSPGDLRGWTCKLADFGFALVLDQQDKATEGNDESSKSSGTAFSPGAGGGCGGGSSTGGGRSGWYTIQAQASGTVTHMAPEAVVKNGRIDSSVDIYALGIIAWELVCGRGQRPFRHLEPVAIPGAVAAGMRPVFPAGVSAPYRKMAQACWAQEPHRRPRAADIVSFIKTQLAALP
ncbi:hypothetical protein Vretimale_6468 [Volvox reticuliferus]|uniref:Protein kinase domain-containing protein n=1 Tax=Volvox reticuliferus TaxID=1737510 RepID=A0A8J4LLR2_9CHLO|nr:hypothetical protein Vretimale_6468 [Volvox reticuliferus]